MSRREREGEGRHELFVWYRVSAHRADETRSAVQAMQSSLEVAWPGLVARLLVRDDEGEMQTWMETYALAKAHVPSPESQEEAALARSIDEAAAAALAGRLEGPRHVERFRPVEPR